MGNSDGGTMAVQGLLALKAMMEKLGLDYARAARQEGLDPDPAPDPEVRVPLRGLARALENVARETGNDALGVQLGEMFEIGLAGTIDYVIANAPTLRVALQDHVRFLHLVADGLETQLEEGPRTSYVKVHLPASFGPRVQLIDAVSAVRVLRIRQVMRDPAFPIMVELQRKRPRQLDDFRRILGTKVRFEQDENRIGIASRTLDEKLPAADPRLYQVVRLAAEKMLSERERTQDTLSRVTSFVGSRLQHGDVTLPEAAEAVGVSAYRLRRELAQSHMTFRQLLDETRKSMAAHYIHETALPMTEIAFLLGFSELSAFSRAAKNWFGRAPLALRTRGRGRG